MATPIISPVETSADYPKETTVVVIGGGIAGLVAALNLAEPLRSAKDMPLAKHAEQFWTELPQRTGMSVGYRQAGIMYVAKDEGALEPYKKWLAGVSELDIPSRLVSAKEIKEMVPERWYRAHPWIGLAAFMIPQMDMQSRRWPRRLLRKPHKPKVLLLWKIVRLVCCQHQVVKSQAL